MNKKIISLFFITALTYCQVTSPIQVVVVVPFERIERAVTTLCGGIASCAKGTYNLVKNNPTTAAVVAGIGISAWLLNRNKRFQEYMLTIDPMPGNYERLIVFHDGTGKLIRFEDCRKVSERVLSRQEVKVFQTQKQFKAMNRL